MALTVPNAGTFALSQTDMPKDKTRRKVGEALVALIEETGMMPDAQSVADRAGIGRRTLFRYFDGQAELEVETARVMRQIATERLPLPKPVGDLDERIKKLVSHRAELYELITPVRRFLDAARSRGNSEIDELIDEARKLLRKNLTEILGNITQGNRRKIDAADIITSWEVWRAIREGQNKSINEARRQMENMLLLVISAD